MKNPFGQIVSFEDYVDIIGIPKEQLNSEEVKNRINKWLVQATEQFDSMISGNGQLGRLYRWFEKLEDNEEDNYKKYKLIKAICSWVETFVIKGKFWVDGLPVINSNVDIQINSSSNDSNVEAKRKDIIQDLVSVGLYQTTNFGDNGTFQDNQQNAEQLIEDLIVLSTSELQQNYLKLNPQKSLEGNLDFANNDLVNGGNIIGSTQHARNNIQYYNIIDSTIDLNKNTVIGTLGQDPTTAADIAQINQNIANINQEQITQNSNISNNANEISSLKTKDIEQNNRLTQLEQETTNNRNEIANIKTKDQQQDNSIQSNTTNIQTNTNNITALDSRLVSVSGLLNQTIEGLRTLRPFKYVGEYQNGTSYNINQLVSYNNNLYLSKEDNNNTTPPSDKWLLINKDTISVDLSDYPTKLEVEAIKNTLQQSITSNTTNITTNKNNIDKLNNEVVKIAGQQIITGKKIFTGPGEGIQIRPNATGGSSYITGYDLDGKIKKWVLGNTGKNEGMLLEAPQGNIYLKPSASNNGYIDCYNTRISRIANPTANTDATNKQYVDNKVSTNTTNITTIRNNYLDKTATGAQQIAATSLYVNNQLVVNTPYNPIMTPNADLYVSGQGFIENLEADNATFNTSIIVPTPTQNDHAATKQYVDNAIANSGGTGSIDTSNFATLNTNQTISGQKTFTNRIFANGGITNLPNPTNTQEAANKQYVDNKTSLYTMFSSNTIYNNLQKITTRLFDNSAVDYNKPLTVSFTRTNNSGADYGSYIFQIQYGVGENNFVVGSNLYYDRSKTYGQLGDWVALTITPSYIQVQCWNGGDRIKNIKVQGWQKV